MTRWMMATALALGLVAASCGGGGPSVAFGDVPDSVEGNVVVLPVSAEGVEIVGADGDTSGESGHFHVFIDGDPVDVGDTIPREAGVIHSIDDEIMVTGLSVGEHTFTVVIGDGTHVRFGDDLIDTVTVDVQGPSIQGEAPADIAFGETLNIDITSEGVDVVAADGDTSGDSGHYHVLVNPEMTPTGGMTIPAAEEGKIIHSTNSTVAVSDLPTGDHEIWLVLGDGAHIAFDPPVMAKLAVTVTEA